MLKSHRDIIYPDTEDFLLRTAEQVAGNQAFYEADADIYGQLAEVLTETKHHAARESN